jgi:hypothetical protein
MQPSANTIKFSRWHFRVMTPAPAVIHCTSPGPGFPEFPFESYVQTNLGAYMLQSQIHGEDDQVPLLPRFDSNS